MTESKFSKYSEMSEEKRAKLREIEVSIALKLKLHYTGLLSLFPPNCASSQHHTLVHTVPSLSGNLHTSCLPSGLLVQASLLSFCYDFTCVVVCVFFFFFLLACLVCSPLGCDFCKGKGPCLLSVQHHISSAWHIGALLQILM